MITPAQNRDLNRPELLGLIKFLEAIPSEKFDMQYVVQFEENHRRGWTNAGSVRKTRELLGEHGCGTAACLAGWQASRLDDSYNWEEPVPAARRSLGLSYAGSQQLFSPIVQDKTGRERSFSQARDKWFFSKARALRTLRHLYKTGEVNWLVKS